MLRTRSVALELLDGEQLDAHHLAVNLREMAMLNRLPGGVADSVRAVDRLLGEQTAATVLDVGTGFGDFPRRLRRRGRSRSSLPICGRRCWISRAVTWRVSAMCQ